MKILISAYLGQAEILFHSEVMCFLRFKLKRIYNICKKSCLALSISTLLFCFLGQGGQCRAYRGYLVAVAAVVVCMRVWSLTLSPCPAHNAVVHTERGAKGPRAG